MRVTDSNIYFPESNTHAVQDTDSRGNQHPLLYSGRHPSGRKKHVEDDKASELGILLLRVIPSSELCRNLDVQENCEHVYEKKTILAYIKYQIDNHRFHSNSRRCPVAGCGNKRRLTAQDLVDFPDFFEHIRDN
uniref:E3 SUMO-protein ligase NSE2 n=1 Tax=Steinernema glaseri TaxID=37863 RepID=A0A1I7YDG2_9BILA